MDKEELEHLILMLRELDLKKNNIETIRYVLNYIADSLTEIIDKI